MSRDSPELVLIKAALWNGLLYLTWPIWLPLAVLREVGRLVARAVRAFKRSDDSDKTED